jgi:uncharacterized membrane protein
MTENPYAPPAAAVVNRSANAVKLYSPAQAACGALVGGPVGLIYFLWANFTALGNRPAAKKTIAYGALLILGLLIVLPFLPERFPSSPFTVAYIIMARQIAQQYQKTKQEIADSPEYDFHSNWRVFGLGLLCLVGSVLVIVVPLALLVAFGIWNP